MSAPASDHHPIPTTEPADRVDVVIVGGGPTGLAAAVALGRSLRSALVVDSGQPRNAPSTHAHNVLGNEGLSPADYLAAGRREAAGYGVAFTDAEVTKAASADEGVALELADGSRVQARALLLATGVRDRLPEIPGLAAAWGGSVLHCPYCHGYEMRGRRIGVLATSPMSAHHALLLRQLSDDVTVFLHAGPEVLGSEADVLAARGVTFANAQVSAVLTDPSSSSGNGDGAAQPQVTGVQLSDGSVCELDALFIAPVSEPRAELFEQLGGTLAEHPAGRFIQVGPMFDTGIPHVWAAGNVTDLRAMVASAAAAGLNAAIAINTSLATAEAHQALAALQPS